MRLLTIKMDVRRAQREIGLMGRRERAHLTDSVRRTSGVIARDIKRDGDTQIREAGNFSERWTRAFEVQESESTRHVFRISLGFNSSIPYAHAHEFGARIKGNPLLWIPLAWANLKGVWARNFPGRLFRVNRPGRNPLLFSTSDKQAKYVGVRFVNLRPRFRLRSLASRVMRGRAARTFLNFWTIGGR